MINGKNKVCISYAGNRMEDINSTILLCHYLELRLDLCSFSDSEYSTIFSTIDNSIVADHSEKRKEKVALPLVFRQAGDTPEDDRYRRGRRISAHSSIDHDARFL